MIMWIYGCESLTLVHHIARFSGIRNCGNEDKMLLIYHETLKDHLFMVDVPHDLGIFHCQGPCGSRDIKYLICYMTSCHQFRELCDFICGNPLL